MIIAWGVYGGAVLFRALRVAEVARLTVDGRCPNRWRHGWLLPQRFAALCGLAVLHGAYESHSWLATLYGKFTCEH